MKFILKVGFNLLSPILKFIFVALYLSTYLILRFLLLIRKYHIGYEGCRSSKLQIEECHDVLLSSIVDDHKKFSFRTETLD